MRRRVIDRDGASYGIDLGPLATPGAAFALWARNLLPLTCFALVPAAAALIVEWIALGWLADGGAPGGDAETAAASLSALLTFPLAYGATAATFLMLDARVRGAASATSAFTFFGRGLRLFGRLFGVFFLMGLALLAPLAPAGVLWKLDLIAAAIPLAAAALAFDVWLLVRWSVAAPTAVIEDVTFSVAFERSKRLVAGSWWRSFGALALIAAAAALAAFGISQAAGSVSSSAGTAQALGNFVTSVVTSPPLDCTLFALYAALRDRQPPPAGPDAHRIPHGPTPG